MSSNSIMSNIYVNKLQVNKLQAQEIKVEKTLNNSTNPSYLFSVIFQNATFTRDLTGGTLMFNLNEENNNVIMFSDRPFRQTNNISIEDFVAIFTQRGTDSFEKDPPNAVLTHSNEQQTYIVRLSEINNNNITFNLELLPGETHNLDTVNGQMNLFVDNVYIDNNLDVFSRKKKN